MKSLIIRMMTFGLMSVAALGVTFGAAQADSVKPKIVVVTHGQASDPYWTVVKNGVAQAAKDLNVDVDYRAPETYDMITMAQLIDAAVNQAPDGIAVSLPDADALGPSIQKAVAAGIPVVTIDAGAPYSKQLGALMHIGQDNSEAGRFAGEFIRKAGKKNVLCVIHEPGNVSLEERCKGVAESVGDSGTVKNLPTTMDYAETLAKIQAALTSDSTIDFIVTAGAAMVGEPAVEAVNKLGMVGQVQVGSFDLSDGFLKALDKGDVAVFTVDQQQYMQGYLAVSFLALNARYGLKPAGNVPTGPTFVLPKEAARVIELSAKGIR